MTEQQQYEVLESIGATELRRYARCTVADVVMSGSAERAGNKAFGSLVRYISAAQLSMTAPVLQTSSSSSSSSSSSTSDSWVVSFVLPGSKGIDDYPLPTDAQVTLREIPSHLAGRWTYSSVQAHTSTLQHLIASSPASGSLPALVAIGAPVWARYDPPWKPWFLRRNEVLIEVQEVS